jgi:hypothetical protein
MRNPFFHFINGLGLAFLVGYNLETVATGASSA